MVGSQAKAVVAATDGACSGNPGPGGWGALIRFDDGSIEEWGGHERLTTNNRMELQAALSLLEKLKGLPRHAQLTIKTDSKYLIDGFDKWMPAWKRKSWKTAGGKPVMNQDLWKALDFARLPDVPLVYVKGHSGDPDNDRVDEIAVSFSKGLTIDLQSDSLLRFKGKEKESTDLPSLDLNGLLSRLELADRFAQNGFGLTLAELSELVEQPIDILRTRQSAWQWRDWVLVPLDDGRWKLFPTCKEQQNFEKKNDI